MMRPSADRAKPGQHWVIVTTEHRGVEFYRAYCGVCRRYVHKSPGVRQPDLARVDARQHVALFHGEAR
jgi:hypothetical protein